MIPAIACLSHRMGTSSYKFDCLPAFEAPYLVLAKGACKCEHNNYPAFLSISDGNVYHCNIPSLMRKLFVGAHHGWLGHIDQFCEPSIVNPITGQKISLPSVTTLTYIYPSYKSDESLNCYFAYDEINKMFIKHTPKELCTSSPITRITFSADPSSTTDFTVAAINEAKLDLIFTKPNEGKWNTLKFKDGFVDLTFRQEKILALTLYGAIHLITLGEEYITNEEISAPLVQANHAEHRYLVDDNAYGILQVVRDLKTTTHPTTRAMTVLRLVVDGQGNKTWEVLKSLDGGVIFIGAGATTVLTRDKVCGAIKPNSVYFTDDWWDLLLESHKTDRDVGRYSLENDSLEFFPRNFYHVTWPPPIWIH